MASSAGVAPVAEALRYARFSRRLRAIAIDYMLFLVATVVALQLAVAFDNNELARVIGFGFLAGFVLYEPLLVSLTGGTVGHHLSNLRVVDDRSHGNVGLLKAFARVVIKVVLSWYSFISMAAARRHQAVHDLLTRSTVQIRDPAKALPSHYARERVELSSLGMPPRWRRLVVTAAYLLASVVLLSLVAFGLQRAGVYSRTCLDYYERCTLGERLTDIALGLGTLVMAAVCLGLGWRGRLWGARRRTEAA